jgi:hypothetical protein
MLDWKSLTNLNQEYDTIQYSRGGEERRGGKQGYLYHAIAVQLKETFTRQQNLGPK